MHVLLAVLFLFTAAAGAGVVFFAIRGGRCWLWP